MPILVVAGILWGAFVGWNVKGTIENEKQKVEQCADCKPEGEK